MASNNAPLTQDAQKIIGIALSDMEYKVQLFNTLSHTCFSKCVDKRYKEGELNIGESTCIDRCVSKYNQGVAAHIRLPYLCFQHSQVYEKLIALGEHCCLLIRTEVNNMIGQILASGKHRM